ncbi:DUF86 domain-containing protein [Halorhabdus sp. BNX81]|uniref:type VII toxin-antitoxin system HepT family RNase toxin n=1 Tax=Halorhabdus sp. BNX81 TaxID=2980181 RepID=UPI0023DD11E6|nr:DUF86 domain-containing protein [Halorhabdus sp. BNX81]WEL22599.1 Protein of unknown function DUF86 [Halorhabdus sp. BNX81]
MSNSHDPERLETIVEKAEYVQTCLEVLAANQSVSRESFREQPETRDVVERRFEKASQACIDIGRMLVRDIDGHSPGSNAATMRRLGEVGVLSKETAESMAEAAMFRNVLAHEYGDVLDQDIVYDALQDLGRYRDFLVAVSEYLDDVNAL